MGNVEALHLAADCIRGGGKSEALSCSFTASVGAASCMPYPPMYADTMSNYRVEILGESGETVPH